MSTILPPIRFADHSQFAQSSFLKMESIPSNLASVKTGVGATAAKVSAFILALGILAILAVTLLKFFRHPRQISPLIPPVARRLTPYEVIEILRRVPELRLEINKLNRVQYGSQQTPQTEKASATRRKEIVALLNSIQKDQILTYYTQLLVEKCIQLGLAIPVVDQNNLVEFYRAEAPLETIDLVGEISNLDLIFKLEECGNKYLQADQFD